MENRNGRHLLSNSTSGSSSSTSNYVEEHTNFYEQASNKERELQKQLDSVKKQLEEERERMWSSEADMQVTLSGIKREVCEFKNQLMLMRTCIESEHREWETIRGRLETQIERERLKVRSRDVHIHELKLSKEQETATLSNQLTLIRNQLETENRSLREQLAAAITAPVSSVLPAIHPPL